MKAAAYIGEGRFSIQEIPDPKPGKDEVIIRVRATSICGSDVNRIMVDTRPEIFQVIQGHEYAGDILEAKAGFSAGERVCVYPVTTCGICDACRQNLEHLCMNLGFYGVQLNGGFAEKAALPAKNLYRLPAEIDAEHSSLVEPLAVSLHAVRKAKLSKGETGVIFGFGLIGYFCARLLRDSGLGKVFIVDVNPKRLEFARVMGFETLNPAVDDLVEEINYKNDGSLADLVFDCAGKPDVPNYLVNVSRIAGRIILVGTYETIPQVDLQKVIRRELQVNGSRIYTRQDFLDALNLLKTWKDLKKIPLLHLPLEKIDEAFTMLLGEPEALKIILTP